MRVIGIGAVAALGVVSLFPQASKASDGVVVTSPSRTWQAEYVVNPGVTGQSTEMVEVTRQLKFYFPDAKIDPSNSKTIAPDSDSNIREYLSSDVSAAISSAQAEASAHKQPLGGVLPKYLENLRYKTVDCRQVTRKVIETLIGNRVNGYGDGSIRYVRDEDQMDVAMTAKQFDSVTISRDPSISDGDTDPRYTCRETSVLGTSAKCGDLRIKYNPIEAKGGVFKGRKVVVFDADSCAKSSATEDFEQCELAVQSQRCGLRYTQKADGARSVSFSTRGLADLLERNRNAALRAYEAGNAEAENAQAGSTTAPAGDSAFLSGFRSPNDPAASRPAD